MPGERTELRRELDRLILQGDRLHLSMASELSFVSDDLKVHLEKNGELPNFKDEYDSWYSVAMQVIKQILPDRLDDFVAQYKNEKRKKIDPSTYTISDYIVGLQITHGPEVLAGRSAAYPRLNIQRSILASATGVLDSSIVDLAEVLQADMFDSELEAAAELGKKGFLRGAGAIAGVVLEKHLSHVCQIHRVKSRKKRPTINDYNQLLKDNKVIDTAKWRFVQHLGDLRNLCDHQKERDPTGEDISELVEGVGRVTRTVY